MVQKAGKEDLAQKMEQEELLAVTLVALLLLMLQRLPVVIQEMIVLTVMLTFQHLYMLQPLHLQVQKQG